LIDIIITHLNYFTFERLQLYLGC